MDDLRIRLALDGADQIQANANRAAQAMEGLGARTAQAGQRAQLSGQQMAQVSAQLQDLFVQIQAGGSPITALLQQGSQLSSVFGGVGNALRGVASLITPAVAVIGTLGAAVTATAAAYAQGSKEADEYRKALVLSGNAAGVTVGQLQDMARAQAALVGTQGRAAEALTVLASSGTVAAAQLQAATDAAIRLERVGGPAAEETAKKFARLGQDPVKALAELNKAENFLTEAVYRRVKALQEQGRVEEAAALAQSTYAETLNSRTAQLEQGLGSLQRGWRSVAEGAKSAWDAMLDIGRATTVEKEIVKAQEQLEKLRSSLAGKGLAGPRATFEAFFGGRSIAQQIADQEALLSRLRESVKLGSDVAQAERTRAQAVTATLAAEEKAQQVRTRIARDAQAQQERDNALRQRAIGLSGDYAKSLAELQSARQRGVLTEGQYVDLVEQLINQQPFATELVKADTEARKAREAVARQALRTAEQEFAAVQKSAASAADQVQKLRDEEQAALLAAAQNISLAEAIQQVAIARLEEAQARATGLADFETAAALREEIENRKELITLIRSRELRDASKQSAEDAARDWQRASQDIERSLTDALLRGFESGKDFGRVLVDTLKNLFSTLVLRPLIQPVIAGLSGSLGLSSTAQAATGGGGPLQSLLGGGAPGAGGSLGATLGPMLLGAGVGIYGGRAIGNGYSIGGGSGNTLVNVGTTVGAFLGGPVGAAIGGTIAGTLNRAFGRRAKETTDSGISGTIGGGDLAGQTFSEWLQKGGWFRSDKRGTDTSAIDAELEAGLDLGAKAILENTRAWAQALQLPAEQLASVTSSFRVSLGQDQAANEAAIAGVLQGYSDALTAGFTAQIAPFVKSGETAAQTLERLAGSITGVNGVLGVLGQSLLAVSTTGADTASKLLEQFGGLQQFQAASGQYLQDYYTEAERTALATQQLTEQLAGVGVALPASRDAYRQLVEAQDLNTESGRKAYAALLQLAPSFAQLVPAVTDLGNAAAEAARLAEQAAEQQREAGRRVLADLAREGVVLQVELLRAQGQEAAAAELARQQTLASLTAGLSSTDAAAVTALLDLNLARRAEIDAILATQDASRNAAEEAARQAAEAQQRAQAVASQRDSLTERLLQLQGNTAELRARELAALDPANRALQEQINALLDQQAAAQAAAQASQDAAQALQAFQGVLGNLASQRGDLEVQLLQAQGKTAEADALQRQQALARLTAGLTAEQAAQVTAAYDYNAALQRQIQATTDAAQAAQQLAADQARAASEAERAAEAIRQAWQSAADNLFSEAARIRGLIAGQGGGLTLAQAQAQFAIATGQARSGDQDAARRLPALSQTLLDLATANASSLLELNRIRAAIAASLEGTGQGLAGLFSLQVPKLATGTAYVPRDMLALLHEGEAVVPKPFNPAAGNAAGGDAMRADLRELLDAVKAGDLAAVRLLTDLLRIVKTWDGNGLPEERATA